jgi:hypothetical protein
VLAICAEIGLILTFVDSGGFFGLYNLCFCARGVATVFMAMICYRYLYSVVEVQYLWMSATPPIWLGALSVFFNIVQPKQ